jgi:hypothetical protein
VSLVYSRTGSGLVVASHGSDEASVARALKQHDHALRLVRQGDPHTGVVRWCVYAYQGPDREAVCVTAWVNDAGDPLPLSHALVDRVISQDKNSRAERVGEDELNRRAAEARQRQWEDDIDALETDWRTPHGRPILHRGVGLRMARDKRRARGEKV